MTPRAPSAVQMECSRLTSSLGACLRTNLTNELKLLEQGSNQPGSFLLWLGWSVCRHGLLRSRWIDVPPAEADCLPAFLHIASHGESSDRHTVVLQLVANQAKEEGRPSRWRDGLARSLAHESTNHVRRERGWKLLARGALGPSL